MQCYECSETIADDDSTVGIFERHETFCCETCASLFIGRLALPVDTAVYVDHAARWPGTPPEPSPLVDAVLRATVSTEQLPPPVVGAGWQPHDLETGEEVRRPAYVGDGLPRLTRRPP